MQSNAKHILSVAMETARLFFFLVLVVFIQSACCLYPGGNLPRSEMMTWDSGHQCPMVENPSNSSAITYVFNGMLFLFCVDATGSIRQEFVAHCIDGKWSPSLGPEICSAPAPPAVKNDGNHSSFKEVHTYPGGTAFLLCGNSNPTRSTDEKYVFEWYRFDTKSKFSLYSNNETFPRTPERYSFHNNKLTGSSTLVIHDVDPSDEGEYVCGVQSTTDGKEFSLFARNSVVLKVIAPGKPLWPNHQTDIQMETGEVQERSRLMSNISTLMEENEKLQKLVDEGIKKRASSSCTQKKNFNIPWLFTAVKNQTEPKEVESHKIVFSLMPQTMEQDALTFTKELLTKTKDESVLAESLVNKFVDKYKGHWNAIVLPRVPSSDIGLKKRFADNSFISYEIEKFTIFIYKDIC